ncbi:NAD-P-binding protein [Trametes versicolor FP-101664 SS1]|uniref:NAD-P-binding protein n=1 Tax=Trametes versicolor (strain FP-101664) TaxID=717944 RepID=UPI00046217DF|nr:NAD-P-binding protein [Trametes versicolor FP-101664 SS1]EIW64465.1 NAD-P-binding protein [Trametes versicolor FP-101664 SS1]
MDRALHERPGHAHLLHTPQTDSIPFSRPTTPGQHAAQIGFCGLGAMGYPMARNLAKWRREHVPGSLPILVWNRTQSKAEELRKELGDDLITVADSLEEIATECEVVFTNLAEDSVVKNVYEAFAKALKESNPTKNKIFVETSTIYPTVAAELDTLLSKVPHTHFVTSPVFGPPASAAAAQLLIVMSGDYRSKKEIAHILIPAVGRKAMDLGGNIEKAPTFKLIGNSLILGSLELLAEVFTLSEKAGIGASQVQQFIKDTMPAPPLISYGEKMVQDNFDGSKGFAIDGGLKDSAHIRKLATELDSPMPALDAAHQHMLTARALHANQVRRGHAHYGVLDWSSLVAGARVAAGLDGFDSSKHQKVVPED